MVNSNNFLHKAISTCVVLLLAFAACSAAERVKYTFKHQGFEREYWVYKPDGLAEDAPLLFLLHGYGGKAEGYRKEMIETADKHGFAVCIPQALKDSKNKTGWNVGYPSQEGMKVDDVDFLCKLAKYLQKEHNLSKENTFVTGSSNGGEMCYLLALTKPDVFSGFAPISGLTMEWYYRQMDPKKPVPLMEVHGTADKTSRWEGDPDNKYGWGEYISVPLAVSLWANEARCTHEITEERPLRRNKVIVHRFVEGTPAWEGGPAIEVRLYEVIGGKHSWAFEDMDTCEEIWNFFSTYLR